MDAMLRRCRSVRSSGRCANWVPLVSSGGELAHAKEFEDIFPDWDPFGWLYGNIF
jgi:hypothetical protein